MAKVIQLFSDKYTGKLYEIGTEFTGTEERIAELVKLGFLEAEKPKKRKAKKE